MQNHYVSVSSSGEPAVKAEPQPAAAATPALRYVRKEGGCNVVFRHVPEEWLLFVTDIFTTLVEIRWRVMVLVFALSYILSWFFFGVLFWLLALAHGDVSGSTADEDVCVYEVRSFTAAFLFSLETQTTIGYGFHGMSENCALAVAVVTVQDVVSCFIDTFVIGIVVAKMASAKKRAQTVGFSSRAVINLRDAVLTLSWRVGDFRRHHLVEGVARAQLVRAVRHATGKLDVTYQDLEIQQSHVVLVTPATVSHQIGPGSPFYCMGPAELHRADFELLVSFTYTDDSTGMLHQTRTSYTPDEILWGQLFQEMVRVSRRCYRVDYALFHQTARVLVPQVSARDYEHRKRPSSSPAPSPRQRPRKPDDNNALTPPTKRPGPSLQQQPDDHDALTPPTKQPGLLPQQQLDDHNALTPPTVEI